MDTGNNKTSTIGLLVECLHDLPKHRKVVEWKIIADKPFRYPVRKSTDTVGALIEWLSRFPKKTPIAFFLKMMDRPEFPHEIESPVNQKSSIKNQK